MEKHKGPHPPKVVITLLHLICHPDYLEEIEGDLQERYHRDVLKHGEKVARKNVWWQLLLLVRPTLMFHLTANPMKNYFNPTANPQGLLVPVAFFLFACIGAALAFGFDFAEREMFALPFGTVIWLVPALLLVYWFMYLGANRLLYSKRLSLIHTVATVAITLAFVALALLAAQPYQAAADRYELVGNTLQLLAVAFAVTQLVFVWNVLGGVIMKIGVRSCD